MLVTELTVEQLVATLFSIIFFSILLSHFVLGLFKFAGEIGSISADFILKIIKKKNLSKKVGELDG